MKKILMVICFMIAAVTMVSAQRAAEKKAETRKGLKEQVMLTDTQIESVMAIEEEFRPKLREIKSDEALSEDRKASKSKAIHVEKKAKLEGILGKDLAQKVEAFYKEQKQKTKPEESLNKEKKGKS